MKKYRIIYMCIALGSMVLPQLSAAAGDSGVSVKVSTLGLGIEYVKPLNSQLSARFGVNGFVYNRDFNGSKVNLEGRSRLLTLSAIADYHPWNNGFHLSAGVLYNANKVSADAKLSDTLKIGSKEYTPEQIGSASGKVDFNSLSPYVGIGWRGGSPESSTGWSFNTELGVIYHGEPDFSLSVTCGTVFDNLANECNQLKSDAAKEQADLHDDLDDFKWYPVLSLGMTYKF